MILRFFFVLLIILLFYGWGEQPIYEIIYNAYYDIFHGNATSAEAFWWILALLLVLCPSITITTENKKIKIK